VCARGPVCVSKPRAPLFRRLDRLAIEDPSARLPGFTSGAPHITAEQVRHHLPGPILPP
jgi:hypothetical protein